MTAEIVGKPSLAFFNTVLNDIGISAHEVRNYFSSYTFYYYVTISSVFFFFCLCKAVMVGDDIVNDVGGAQACGLAGVLVRTGKYR